MTISIVYALRPVLFFKKEIWPTEIVNLVVVVISDYIIWYYMGWNAMIYLLIGAWISIGPHPAAVHVIAEHYEFT